MAETTQKVEFFQIKIDGKTFGPFPKTKQRRFQALRHRAGVVFQTVLMDAETVRKQKAESRKQKAESRWLPLNPLF